MHPAFRSANSPAEDVEHVLDAEEGAESEHLPSAGHPDDAFMTLEDMYEQWLDLPDAQQSTPPSSPPMSASPSAEEADKEEDDAAAGSAASSRAGRSKPPVAAKSVPGQIRMARLLGKRPFDNPALLPAPVRQRVDGPARGAHDLTAELCRALGMCLRERPSRSHRLVAREALTSCYFSLISEDALVSHGFAQVLGTMGGVDAMGTFLLALNTPAVLLQDAAASPSLYDIVKMCIRVLREVAFQAPEFAEWLARDEFLEAVSKYLEMAETFQMAELLMEEILVARRSVFDFSKLPSMPGLLQRLTPGQLAWFCRIASTAWTEPEERELDGHQAKSFGLLKQRFSFETAEVLGTNLAARNQALFLESPVFLPRLVALLRHHPHHRILFPCGHPDGNTWRGLGSAGPRLRALRSSSDGSAAPAASPPRVLRELADIVNRTASLALSALTGRSASPVATAAAVVAAAATEEPRAVVGGGSTEDELLRATLPMRTEDLQEMQFWMDAHQREVWLVEQRTEVMLVLCSLCSGQHKRRAQDELVKHGIVDALLSRFDLLVWHPKYRPERLPPEERPHGPDCSCNPHGQLKTQLLRLVHNLCDRESDNRANKLAVFSSHELDLLERGAVASKAVVQFPDLSPGEKPLPGLPGGPDTVQNRGLAWRIASVLICDTYADEGADVDLRFWLCAALEALLRGSSRQVRMLVCSWGVLEAAARAVLSESADAPRPVMLQTTFDLLGELVKDSPSAVAWLAGREVDGLGPGLAPGDLASIYEVAMRNLVGGNVFLRSLYLTLSRAPPGPEGGAHLELVRARLFGPLHTRLVRSLWTVISIADASQENLCALNTAVVLLTLARLEGRLLRVLEEADAVDLDLEDARVSGQLVQLLPGDTPRAHFRKLLWFWSAYYSCRQIDRDSVELSSGIRFEELYRTVQVLCSAQGEPGALLGAGQVVHVPFAGFGLLFGKDGQLSALNKTWASL